MSEDILHKRYSPSQADRIFRCPGSVALVEKAPERREDKYSAEGTKAHAILAAGIQNGKYTFMAAKALSPHKDEHFGGEFMRSVNDAFDYVALIYNELQTLYGDATIYCEVFVDVPVSSAPGEAGGHVDIAIHSAKGRHLYVIDYKHGAGVPVDIKGNKQVKQYGAGFLWEDNAKIRREDVELITLAIVQPRSFHKDGPIREWDVTPAQLLEYIFELDDAIAAAQEPDAPLIPGPIQCQFCDAKVPCPALRSKALTALNPEFGDLSDVTEKKLSAPEELPVDRLTYALQMKPMITLWLNTLERYAKEQLTHGHDVPGFKVVEVKAKREWYGDPEVDISPRLAALCNCKPEELFKQKFINITDAEKKIVAAFKKNVPRKRKNAAAEDARRAFAYFTTKQSSGNLTLVTNDDARPAVNKSQQVFGNVSNLITQPSKEK